MTTIKSLGEHLRARRRELGLTLGEVASIAGLSLAYVSNLERGHGNPTLDALRALAAALEMPMNGLLDEGDTEAVVANLALASVPASLDRFAKSERFTAMVERLADLQAEPPDEMRRRLLVGMANAPRRASGEPSEEDWRRLLDTYRLMLEPDG
jgi:transcriptional regulator with XRE-family HTH domain